MSVLLPSNLKKNFDFDLLLQQQKRNISQQIPKLKIKIQKFKKKVWHTLLCTQKRIAWNIKNALKRKYIAKFN